MKNFILSNINLIEELQNQLSERDQLIAKLIHENESLKQRLQRYKHSKGSNKKSDFASNNNTNNSSNNNNNINNNAPANKNKSERSHKDENLQFKEKRVSIDTSEDEIQIKKRSEDSQESISIKLSNKNLFLMTNKEYRINDWKTYNFENEDIDNKSFEGDVNLEIPKWIERDLTPSPTNEIENIPVEDTSDEAYLKRHLKYEADERRRKKWDQQRIREQKNIERLKKRHLKEEYAEMMSQNNKIQKTLTSFFPDVKTIKFIQISDDLPISAFGEQIPKLIPKDFTLPWLSDQDNDNSNVYSIDNLCTNGTSAKLKVRTKFISRCSNPISK